jgi:hypothetical protein
MSQAIRLTTDAKMFRLRFGAMCTLEYASQSFYLRRFQVICPYISPARVDGRHRPEGRCLHCVAVSVSNKEKPYPLSPSIHAERDKDLSWGVVFEYYYSLRSRQKYIRGVSMMLGSSSVTDCVGGAVER